MIGRFLPVRFAAPLILLAPCVLGGCLSNSYTLQHDELQRLAATDSQTRWESVRVVQKVGGDDYPPEGDYSLGHSGGFGVVYVGPPLIHHHHHYHHHRPPPATPPAPRAASPSKGGGGVSPGSAAGGAGALGKGGGSGGNSSDAYAIVILTAVVVGATIGVGAAFTEGVRYDGWVSVHPEEPVHLKLSDGSTEPVPLSRLTPEMVQQSKSAVIYEGESGRFARLGRAPLNRRGFTMTTALHAGGIPELSREVGTGMGGYLHLGGNIENIVTLGLAATADGSVSTQRPVLFATVGPEVHVFPILPVGVYGGVGWVFRNTDFGNDTRADQGWFLRGGVVGDIPLTTRLAIQARVGAVRYKFEDSYAPVTWEGLLGLAVY